MTILFKLSGKHIPTFTIEITKLNFNLLSSYEGRRCSAPTSVPSRHFNPLSSCEGRHFCLNFPMPAHLISIHSPHVRGDSFRTAAAFFYIAFQSTPPRMRGDAKRWWKPTSDAYFNPLPSYEGRQQKGRTACGGSNFNPLPSCEGRQHKPPKIHPDLRQLTQQNHDTPLFWALQAPFCGVKPDIRGAKPSGRS